MFRRFPSRSRWRNHLPPGAFRRSVHTYARAVTKYVILFSVNVHSYNSVTEYLLPEQICQSMISGFPHGSNACTVIATLGANLFLHGQLPIPDSIENIMSSVALFSNITQAGNDHYRHIHLPPGQLNLYIEEALATRDDQFNLDIIEDTAVLNAAGLENKMKEICQSNRNVVMILTAPPDKAMLF